MTVRDDWSATIKNPDKLTSKEAQKFVDNLRSELQARIDKVLRFDPDVSIDDLKEHVISVLRSGLDSGLLEIPEPEIETKLISNKMEVTVTLPPHLLEISGDIDV